MKQYPNYYTAHIVPAIINQIPNYGYIVKYRQDFLAIVDRLISYWGSIAVDRISIDDFVAHLQYCIARAKRDTSVYTAPRYTVVLMCLEPELLYVESVRHHLSGRTILDHINGLYDARNGKVSFDV